MSTIRLRGLYPVDDQLRVVLDAIPALVWLAAPDGAAVYHSQRWLEFTGLSAEQAGGWGWTTAVHQDDIDRLTGYWQTVLASSAPGEVKGRLRRFDGQYRSFLFCTAPLCDASGGLAGWCGTSIEIDDLQRSSERQFRAIVDNIPASIAIHNESGELELENRAAQKFHGRSLDDTKQWQTGDVVHPEDLPALIAAQQRALTTGEPLELELRVRRADGAYRWFQMRSRQSSDDYDGTSRWYTVGTDIHDRKTAEEALLRSETFLLEVQRLSRTGGWRYNPATDVVESSPEIQRVYAVQPGEDISHPPFWFDRIHPEDRPRVQAQFERSLHEKTEYRAGYRIVLPDGSIRYQYATGHPMTNDAGDLVEFIGAFRSDLFYRLNVFPIRVPPLRERAEDIPLLIAHFVRQFAKRHGKKVAEVPDEVIATLMHYSWPGNVRELQNVIERAVVATTGLTLQLPELDRRIDRPVASSRTLAQVERDHIVATLHATNWVLGGWDGAATRLGLSRTTLISRMQRLGISAGSGLRRSASHPAVSRVAKRTPAQPQVAG